MEVNIRYQENVVIVDLKGKLVWGRERLVLKETISQLLEKERKDILLNLSEVKYMDSSGIGELVSSYRAVKQAGGRLKIVHLSNRIYTTLTIMRLLPIFEVFSDERDAVKSFSTEA